MCGSGEDSVLKAKRRRPLPAMRKWRRTSARGKGAVPCAAANAVEPMEVDLPPDEDLMEVDPPPDEPMEVDVPGLPAAKIHRRQRRSTQPAPYPRPGLRASK